MATSQKSQTSVLSMSRETSQRRMTSPGLNVRLAKTPFPCMEDGRTSIAKSGFASIGNSSGGLLRILRRRSFESSRSPDEALWLPRILLSPTRPSPFPPKEIPRSRDASATNHLRVFRPSLRARETCRRIQPGKAAPLFCIARISAGRALRLQRQCKQAYLFLFLIQPIDLPKTVASKRVHE